MARDAPAGLTDPASTRTDWTADGHQMIRPTSPTANSLPHLVGLTEQVLAARSRKTQTCMLLINDGAETPNQGVFRIFVSKLKMAQYPGKPQTGRPAADKKSLSDCSI